MSKCRQNKKGRPKVEKIFLIRVNFSTNNIEILQFSDIKKRNEKYQKIVNSIGKGGVLKLRDSAINIDLVTFISKDWYNA